MEKSACYDGCTRTERIDDSTVLYLCHYSLVSAGSITVACGQTQIGEHAHEAQL